MTPMMVAGMLDEGLAAPSAIACTAWAPSWPTGRRSTHDLTPHRFGAEGGTGNRDRDDEYGSQ